MEDNGLTFDYSAIRPYLGDYRSDSDSSLFTYKADYLNTSLNTSAVLDTSSTTTIGEFWPSYVLENYSTYSKPYVEKEITDEINRLICEELEPKYLIRSIPKDRLKIKKAKINKCYLINF